MKKEIEELEDIPIPTTLQCILRSNVRNLVSNEKRQQSWKLGTPYIDLGQTKRKQAKAYNLMTGIPFLFKQQMQEQINDPFIHLTTLVRKIVLAMKGKDWCIKLLRPYEFMDDEVINESAFLIQFYIICV